MLGGPESRVSLASLVCILVFFLMSIFRFQLKLASIIEMIRGSFHWLDLDAFRGGQLLSCNFLIGYLIHYLMLIYLWGARGTSVCLCKSYKERKKLWRFSKR